MTPSYLAPDLSVGRQISDLTFIYEFVSINFLDPFFKFKDNLILTCHNTPKV